MQKISLFILLAVLTLASCKKDKTELSDQQTRGVIKGKTVKEDGTPISDAKIRIYGTSVETGSNVSFDAVTKADGTYSLTVPDGIYGIDARTVFNYNGALYDLPIHPEDGKDGIRYESKDGVVRNFTLKMSGKTADYDLMGADNWTFSYYGGPFEIRNEKDYLFNKKEEYTNASTLPVGSTVRLTFTPDGPLMDGSQGNVVVREVKIDKNNDVNSEFLSGDVPLGKYNVSAELVDANGVAAPASVSVSYQWNNAVGQVGRDAVLAPFAASAPLTFYMSKSTSSPYDHFLTNTVIFVKP